MRNDAFGGRCVLESSERVLAERPDVEPAGRWQDLLDLEQLGES